MTLWIKALLIQLGFMLQVHLMAVPVHGIMQNRTLMYLQQQCQCHVPILDTLPSLFFFFNTKAENDCSAAVNDLNSRGCNIKYKYCPEYAHGQDCIECTDELLDEFYSFRKRESEKTK